jgi:hypothetical protein
LNVCTIFAPGKKITGTVLLITFSLSVPLSCLGIPLLLLVRLQIYTFGFAACKQELILNTPNSSKENDQENRPSDHLSIALRTSLSILRRRVIVMWSEETNLPKEKSPESESMAFWRFEFLIP